VFFPPGFPNIFSCLSLSKAIYTSGLSHRARFDHSSDIPCGDYGSGSLFCPVMSTYTDSDFNKAWQVFSRDLLGPVILTNRCSRTRSNSSRRRGEEEERGRKRRGEGGDRRCPCSSSNSSSNSSSYLLITCVSSFTR
jgi:hypothetical protein